jgi:hypothetical protein
MNSKEAHLIASISILFGHNEENLMFFWSHKSPEPRLSRNEFKSESQCTQVSEALVVQCAFDFWSTQAHVKLMDVILMMTDEHLILLMKSILYFRELECDLEILC